MNCTVLSPATSQLDKFGDGILPAVLDILAQIPSGAIQENKLRPITIAVLLLTVAAVLPARGADIASGKWAMNIEKSKLANPIKSAVVTINVEGDRETSETHIIATDGKETHTTATFIRDGQEHTYTGGGGSGNSYDSYVARRVAGHESVFEFKKAGKVVRTVRNSYSGDGRSRNLVAKGVDAQGKEYEIFMVFDRQ